ncbi:MULTISPECIES: HAD-IIB family hydrolase [Pseudomonas]|uniref:Haloacid dehalogenase-like hydrolase family protein n=1 Tax=Pseudomonas fluorescens (strain Q2-87) TaxID=1038922 RepID=J2EXB9_PSEFQ|nr:MULTISPECIES: HAD-IIB family hydrolase [Pseudomonas]EJL01208.1 haloacid dehalogenase-like hydrolase family protein [Pseudomonas fluorescens Q2-87]
MYSLIATDLDGTLLLPGDTLGTYTRTVMHHLHDAGLHLVLATGRQQADVETLLHKNSPPLHLITSNGARISSACSGLTLCKALPDDVVQGLIEEARHSPDLIINLYGPSGWLISREHDVGDFNRNPHFQPAVIRPDMWPTQNVEKVFFFQNEKNHHALLTLQKRLERRFANRISTVFSFTWCLEVMASDVCKGHALKQLAAFLDVPIGACIAFGDGMNDIGMLSIAGKAVVMGTAHQEVTQALPDAQIIGACSDEAVARYLSAHVLAPIHLVTQS